MSVEDDLLGLMRLYVAVCDAGGLGAGARRLGLTQPSASRGLKRLEERLGVRLVERSTTSFVLTEEGSTFLADARATLEAAQAATERARAGGGALAGHVTVAANIGVGALLLPTLFVRFQARHPGVTIALRITEQPIAMLREGVDLWLRVGPVPDESLVARPVLLMPRPLLANRAVPDVDAADDAAIAALPWVDFPPFYEGAVTLAGGGPPRRIAFRARLKVDNAFALAGALAAGPAVAMAPRFLFARDIAEGAVRELSPALRGDPIPWTLLLSPGKHRTARVQALADHIVAGLKAAV